MLCTNQCGARGSVRAIVVSSVARLSSEFLGNTRRWNATRNQTSAELSAAFSDFALSPWQSDNIYFSPGALVSHRAMLLLHPPHSVGFSDVPGPFCSEINFFLVNKKVILCSLRSPDN